MEKAFVEFCSFNCAAERAGPGEPLELFCGKCERVEKYHCRPWLDTSSPLPTEGIIGYSEIGGLN